MCEPELFSMPQIFIEASVEMKTHANDTFLL